MTIGLLDGIVNFCQNCPTSPETARMEGEASHEEPGSVLASCRRANESGSERFGTVSRSDRLLNKWEVEERTSLDITTIYREMKAGTFPQPVRVGRRRVAWRESDIAAGRLASKLALL